MQEERHWVRPIREEGEGGEGGGVETPPLRSLSVLLVLACVKCKAAG